MGRDGHRLHAPLMLHAVLIHFGEDHRQGHPLAGADVFDRHIQLYDPALGLQIDVAQIHRYGVGAPGHGQIYRHRALLGVDHHITSHCDRRRGERDHVPLRVGVSDGLVDQFGPLGLAHMPDEGFQHGALTGADSQLRDGPPQGPGVQHGSGALGRRQHVGDHEIRRDDLIDHDIGGARLGDIGRQFGEQFLQIRRVGRDRHMGRVRIAGPLIQSVHIHAVRSDQPDAVDDDPLGLGRGGHRSGRSARRGVPVGEHHDHLGVAGREVEELYRLGERVGVVSVPAGAQTVHSVLQRVHRPSGR